MNKHTDEGLELLRKWRSACGYSTKGASALLRAKAALVRADELFAFVPDSTSMHPMGPFYPKWVSDRSRVRPGDLDCAADLLDMLSNWEGLAYTLENAVRNKELLYAAQSERTRLVLEIQDLKNQLAKSKKRKSVARKRSK